MAPTRHAAAVLGGGAPNGALMAGALCAIYDHDKTFHELYASGAGAVISLAFLAARGMTPDQAMRDVVRVGVHDAIYNWVPLAFKTFFKSGPFTVPFKQLGSRFKVPESGSSADLKRLYNDWVDLVVAAVTPTTITPSSQALCSHYPFIDESLDFDKLKDFRGKFYMNSYCIETGKMEQFSKERIGPEHFCAALSYPFIYPPTKIGNRHYYEGAAHDPLNLPKTHRLCCKNEIGFLVVVDLLGAYRKALIRTPRNLLDAYGISILLPVVAMADKDMTRFMSFHKERRRSAKRKAQARVRDDHEHGQGDGHERHQHDYDVEALTFAVQPSDYPTMCDWSYSNMRRLWDIGYEGGVRFVEKHGDRLPDHAPDSASPV